MSVILIKVEGCHSLLNLIHFPQRVFQKPRSLLLSAILSFWRFCLQTLHNLRLKVSVCLKDDEQPDALVKILRYNERGL